MPTTTTKKPRGGKTKRSRKEPPTDVSAVVKKKKKSAGPTDDSAPSNKEFYCMEKDGERMVVMTEDKVTEGLASGWMVRHTYDNVREALAWNKKPAASAQVESTEASEEEASGEDEEQEEEEEEEGEDDGEDGDGDEEDEEEAEIPTGSPGKTETHKELCSRNGLYYKSYEDVRKVKKHLSGDKFKNLGLDKAATDMKEAAAVVTPKRKKKQPKKKAAPTEVRRSTRAPATVPVYKEPKNEEDDPEEEEEERKEEASDYEEEEEGDDKEEDSEEEEEREDMTSEEEELVLKAIKIDKRWVGSFQKLFEFKKEKGHCKVPTKDTYNKSLGKWVDHQRTNYKAWKKGKKSGQMTQEKVDLLESIGFVWSVQAPPVPWETRFEELKDHKDMIGDCNYPLQDHYSKCTPLGKWVCWQRMYYQKLKTGQKFNNNGLTKERVKQLKDIGFDFDGPRCKYTR